MGAVLLTNEFPAAGISVFAELWYRESMAGAIYEHDPDLIFSGSDAERTPITDIYYDYYVCKNTFHKSNAYGMCFYFVHYEFSVFLSPCTLSHFR